MKITVAFSLSSFSTFLSFQVWCNNKRTETAVIVTFIVFMFMCISFLVVLECGKCRNYRTVVFSKNLCEHEGTSEQNITIVVSSVSSSHTCLFSACFECDDAFVQ